MNNEDLQKLRREVELAQKHGTTPDISAWTLFELIALAEKAAERAVSPAGEAGSIDGLKPEDITIESWDRHPRTGMQVGMPNGVRLTHKPTATVICVDSNRSQHRNKSLAMDGLRAILESPKPWENAEAKRMLDTAAMYQDLYSKAVERAEAAEARIADIEARKDAAYLERNQVVAALAKCFPSGVARTAIEGWSDDWHGCVYIDLPTGQASWHFHDSHAHLFDGLPQYSGEWDGHDTPEKYRRVAALAARQAPDLSKLIRWDWRYDAMVSTPGNGRWLNFDDVQAMMDVK